MVQQHGAKANVSGHDLLSRSMQILGSWSGAGKSDGCDWLSTPGGKGNHDTPLFMSTMSQPLGTPNLREAYHVIGLHCGDAAC